MKRFFASDNGSGVHPKVMEALMEANIGHTKGYGYDPITQAAEAQFKSLFGEHAQVYFVYSGTGANVLALQACIRPFEAVICSDLAHIHTDETGAPERYLGSKLLALPSVNGKISPEQVREILGGRGVEHHVQPKVLSLTQSTEYGTVYQLDELKAFRKLCDEEGLYMHLDGARIANALASLKVQPGDFMRECGADIVSFGGTKNGMMLGEAVLVLNPALGTYMKYQRKQGMQLYSKMRYIAAQFSAVFKDHLWLQLAQHSNAMAQYLSSSLLALNAETPGLVTITRPVEANGVFCILKGGIEKDLMQEFPFYYWNEAASEIRLMCSWDTQKGDIDAFCAAIRSLGTS